MKDYGTVRDLYKSIDKVTSTNLVIGEWNMNKYQEILEYGIYKDPTYADQNRPYSLGSEVNVLTGQNYVVYEDDTTKIDPDQEFFSQLSSVFSPNRPDPGILLMQHYSGNLITRNSTTIRVDNLSPNIPRYYAFSKNREYDYFNSAKVMGANPNESGIANEQGKILCANPYVVYAEQFPINKITVKLQNHLSVPDSYKIEYLSSGSWQTAFTSTSSALFSSGILDIYLSNGTWSTTPSRLSSVTEVSSLTSNNIKTVKGIRMLVFSMTKNVPGKYGLELIELSPRLEIDLTAYTESFSIDSTMGDTTNIGLPVGSIVASTGNISLSNEDNQFLFSSTLNDFKMLNPDTKFTFYQIVTSQSSSAVIPLKVMYSNQWSVGDDYSVSVSLEDGFKFLRETSAPDLVLQYKSGTKLSTAVLTVLDNVGITGLKFEESSLGAFNTGEDVSIRNFFCKKEQTVAEVLEQLAIATQCSMFYDAEGNLNVLTKERLSEKAKLEESLSTDKRYNPNPDPARYVWYKNDWYFYNGVPSALPSEVTWTVNPTYGFLTAAEYPPPSQNVADVGGKTDFWFILDEDYTNTAGTASAAEYAYTASYTANVSTYSEIKVNPVTDGEIIYHTYGPRKQPGAQNLPEDVLNDLVEDIPASALAFSNYTYATTILWTPGNDNSAVLGAANLTLDMTGSALKDVFTQSYTALNEDEAVRRLYDATNDSTYFPSLDEKLNAKKSMIIFLDRNEGFTFADYDGYVLIDKEYIKYRGKLFSINGKLKILFNQEEFQQELRYIPKGGSIAIIGLIVDVEFKIISQSNGQYTYSVVGDGRAKFGSERKQHFALAENSDGIEPENTFKLTLGGAPNETTPGNINATTKFNFLDRTRYRSVKESLGSIKYNDLQSYLGFLKLSGPKSPAEDIEIIERLDKEGSTNPVTERLKQLNNKVDQAVPGSEFDPYVFYQGERNIYGQFIQLDFVPNSVSTRMRLFSKQKKRKSGEYIAATNSSIAGIGFGLNSRNEGYFVEVESIGAGKDFVSAKARRNNLRMYKVIIENGKYTPKLLFTAPVAAQTVTNTDVQVIKNSNVTTDPVFELEIQIEPTTDGIRYSVYYGNRKINAITEKTGEAINVNNKKIFMFVRNDSQAIYEFMAAAARPRNKSNSSYFKSRNNLDQSIQSGIIPVNKDFYFKNNQIQFYFNDFARLVRQVREYNVRYQDPAFNSVLIDISRVNPEYMIKEYSPTSFGAKIVVVNTSSGPVLLGEDSQSLPLYIVGIQLEELSSGKISMKDYYNTIEEKKLRVTQRERNLSIYGSQTFSLDNEYIQTMSQAKNMMRWITQYCGRQRLKMSLEIFPNPLIELGDKIRIYDKKRGYTLENDNFGDRVFIVSSISHSVSDTGPSMNVEITEVGQ